MDKKEEIMSFDVEELLHSCAIFVDGEYFRKNLLGLIALEEQSTGKF